VGTRLENMKQSSAFSTAGFAAHVMSMRAAEGAGVPQSWDAALQHLQHSAEDGFVLAQAEIAALAGDWVLSREIRAGRKIEKVELSRLWQQIDISNCLTATSKQIVSASPRIAVLENFASPELCRWLIDRAGGGLSRATVYDPASGGPRSESVRTNSQCYFRRDESDLLLLCLRARMARVIELPVAWMEVPMILHYAPGEEFLPHCDFLDGNLPGPARDLAEHGQRVLTFLVSLNDGYEGGETEFPELQRRWKGHTGNAMFFWNVQPDGTPDKRTVHAGLPPVSGEKWLLSQWVRVPMAVPAR
jgi:prolyl 4-hydroxylase